MQTTLKAAVEGYLRSKALSRGTRNEYASTLRKWEQWEAASRSSSCAARTFASSWTGSTSGQPRRHQAEDERRGRRGGALGAEGPAQDLRNVL
jgi:hypothetical protein